MMQTPTSQHPVPPTPPTSAGGITVTPRDLAGVPLTAQEVAGLMARRKVLSDQVSSATTRRREVARQLRSATGADKAGLEQRLAVLDSRIARLESDIDQTGQQLSAAPVAAIAERQQPIFGWGPSTDNRMANNFAPLMGLFILFVLFPIAASVSRGLWKRGSLPRAAAVSPETAQRLDRIEQAIEAVAIEVERISEGQRFVTRLLSEATPSEANAKVRVLGATSAGRTPV
jgi:hypothetical protein